MQLAIEPYHATNQHRGAKPKKNVRPSQHLDAIFEEALDRNTITRSDRAQHR
jgi:hypothetical protein